MFALDLATIVESLTLGAESNNCMADLGNTSFTNMELGPTSITDITKPYPAKEPVPETNTQEVSMLLLDNYLYSVKVCLCLSDCYLVEIISNEKARCNLYKYVNHRCKTGF